MIDLNPSDMACLYSTMICVISHARQYTVTPILTFNQTLWWKVMTVLENVSEDSQVKDIVFRVRESIHSRASLMQ